MGHVWTLLRNIKNKEFPSNTTKHAGLNIAHTAVSMGWPVPKPVKIWKFSYGLGRSFPTDAHLIRSLISDKSEIQNTCHR